MVKIDKIDTGSKTVYFNDDTKVDHNTFLDEFRNFLTGRIAGETLIPADMERFMRRTSSKNLSMLMKIKKEEGFMEGSSNKTLTRGQKIAIGTIFAIVIIGIVVFIILRNQGIIPM